MKKLLLLIIFCIPAFAQTFQNPFVFRVRIAPPEIYNDWERAYEAMFATQFIFTAGRFTAFTGGEYHIGTTGSYALESRSVITGGGHLGVGLLYSVSKSFKPGIMTRRVMHQAYDVPTGSENRSIKELIERYKEENPGNRFLYYNQYGLATFYETRSTKAEVFLHSPIDLPLISFIPELNGEGQSHVGIIFLLLEYQLTKWLRVKGDWLFHSPDADYSKIRFKNGTGALTLRFRSFGKNSYIETGVKREIDPGGFNRNNYVFGGVRFEKF